MITKDGISQNRLQKEICIVERKATTNVPYIKGKLKLERNNNTKFTQRIIDNLKKIVS